MNDGSDLVSVVHDGQVHHPMGGGSYVFRNEFVPYIAAQLDESRVRISIGAQPNSSPHFGTLTVFSLAHSLGMAMKDEGKDPVIFFEVVDTAPGEQLEIDGVTYQKSLRDTGAADHFLSQYDFLLSVLQRLSGIPHEVRRQASFAGQDRIPAIIQKVIDQKGVIGPLLDPEQGLLRMRVACDSCGLTDKKGVNNKYLGEKVIVYCPEHGEFSVDVRDESHRFEFNTPLRNLIRAMLYGEENQDPNISHSWLRVTGSDYAGFYQEQLLYRCAALLGQSAEGLPPIVYAPLTTDWSGAKLSKSLYVKHGAYEYLPPFLVDFRRFQEGYGCEGIEKLFNETTKWVREPYRLFRNYSVHYWMELFNGNDTKPQTPVCGLDAD